MPVHTSASLPPYLPPLLHVHSIMYKPPNPSSILPTASGVSSPTFRSNHPISKVLKSRVVRTIFLAYVGFCALFMTKHLFTYRAQPEPTVYKHYDLQRTYDAGMLNDSFTRWETMTPVT